jgi:hypothetical protein
MLVSLLSVLAAPPAVSGDWIIPAGTTVVYDTLSGPALVDRLIIETGATLRVQGPRPFVVVATQLIQVDGTLDASGFDAKPVFTLFTPDIPEPGGSGAAGGGAGGTGSPLTTASDLVGGDGFAVVPPFGLVLGGGHGGETGFGFPDKQEQRGAGGGGGAFGPDVAGGSPGLAATAGTGGHPEGKGALSGGSAPAQGGAPGGVAFHDADATNDVWGRKLDPVGGLKTGELAVPRPGAGGGAGGDSVGSDAFPTLPFFDPLSGFIDKKGAGGGGGGGLVARLAAEITLGATGAIRADGGDGATGENVLGFDHIAGSSGGGSGGMLILQAGKVDLQGAATDALRAIGGIGGLDDGTQYLPASLSGGGNGGPGLIQIHVRNAAQDVLLPAGVALADLSAPDAHVLLPEL